MIVARETRPPLPPIGYATAYINIWPNKMDHGNVALKNNVSQRSIFRLKTTHNASPSLSDYFGLCGPVEKPWQFKICSSTPQLCESAFKKQRAFHGERLRGCLHNAG